MKQSISSRIVDGESKVRKIKVYDYNQTRQFLALIHKHSKYIEFRTPWPEQQRGEERKLRNLSPSYPIQGMWTKKIFSLEELTDELLDEFKKANQLGYHIFHSINGRLNKTISTDEEMENAKNLCNNICIDFDPDKVKVPEGKTFGEDLLIELIKKTNLPIPTCLAKSGSGYHAYWTLAVSISIEKWREIQANINLVLPVDGATNKPSGMMRLPGFVNAKEKENLKKVILLEHTINPKLYTVDQIERAFGEEFLSEQIKTLQEKLKKNKEPKEQESEEGKKSSIFNWQVVNLLEETKNSLGYCYIANKKIDLGKIDITKIKRKQVYFRCWMREKNHDNGTDNTPSLYLTLRGEHKGQYGCGPCSARGGNTGTFIDLVLYWRDLPNTGTNRKKLIAELDGKYPGFYKFKQKEEYKGTENPLDNFLFKFSNVEKDKSDKRGDYIATCPICKEHKLHLGVHELKNKFVALVRCDGKKQCELLDILIKLNIDISDLEIKKPKVHLNSDKVTAKEKIDNDCTLPLYYDKTENLQILNDILFLMYDCVNLKHISNEDDKGYFWVFNPARNEWLINSKTDIYNVFMYFLDRCWESDGKKKFFAPNPIINGLISMMKAHNWVKEKERPDKEAYNFKPIKGEKELGIDDELLISHLNGNLWIELKPPYREILYPPTPNHFHRFLLPWNYKKYKFIKYDEEKEVGYFKRVKNEGICTDPEEIGKIITSELQPKIHRDWFQNDEGAQKLFYEQAGYYRTMKNVLKLIWYWLKETNAGKMIAMFQINQNLGKGNSFASKISKAGRPFGQECWPGKRHIYWPNLVQNPNNENYIWDFGQQLAEDSGGDDFNVEGKGKKEINVKAQNHLTLIANDDIKIPDQQGEQVGRAKFLPFERDLVLDKNIKIDTDLCKKLAVEKECQIFENLGYDANLARMKREKFSHSKFEENYVAAFIETSNPWAKFVKENLEQVPIKEDEDGKMIGEGIFCDEYLERGRSWWGGVERKRISNKLISVGFNKALKILKWKFIKGTKRRNIIIDEKGEENKKGTTNIPCAYIYGLKWKFTSKPIIPPGDLPK